MKYFTFTVLLAIVLGSISCTDRDVSDIHAPFDINDEGPEILEPLVRAASEQNIMEVRRLLDKGHSVDAKSQSGFTALAIAVRYQYTEIVALLLERGANVWLEDRYGLYPLEIAVTRAGEGEYLDIVRELVKAGADPDKKGPNMPDSPRQYASDVGAVDLLEAMRQGELIQEEKK